MTFKSIINKLAYWTIPSGVYNGLTNYVKEAENRKRENANDLLKSIKQ